MTASGLIAAPFPTPPGVVASLLDELRMAAGSMDEPVEETRRIALLPRPWDPPSCLPEIRQSIYAWMDEVVAWINEEHTWRTDRVLPICWDLHPHVVHELATVACLRWEAGFARTPAALEEWHRFTLPVFLGRVVDRIGETGCPPGRHQPCPGVGRSAIYRDVVESARRRGKRSQDAEATEVATPALR